MANRQDQEHKIKKSRIKRHNDEANLEETEFKVLV